METLLHIFFGGKGEEKILSFLAPLSLSIDCEGSVEKIIAHAQV